MGLDQLELGLGWFAMGLSWVLMGFSLLELELGESQSDLVEADETWPIRF